MSYKIDPRKQIRAVEARLARHADDPQTTRNLKTMREHMRAEALGDFDALMATVSPHAAYTSFNSGPDAPNSPRSREAVAQYYGGMVAANCHQIEHDLDRIVADRDNITTEGTLRIAYPNAVLRSMGHEVADDAPYHLFEARLMIVWGFDADGLVRCEDSYVAGDGFAGIAARAVQQEDIFTPKADRI
ncbi:nuclear transport factor 2 family protein [Paraburkholderia oxyphila]|uniref:nuclear transport factor 2 family protein n=1 Tax=Paraburkholderia oxyphila TaxID=614212 RepID=UPI0004892C2C|nr:nuclear transport factor 2 family protein [Paraburkholderia oxyphila]